MGVDAAGAHTVEDLPVTTVAMVEVDTILMAPHHPCMDLPVAEEEDIAAVAGKSLQCCLLFCWI